MRLLVITKDFPPDVGGIQTYCDELTRRLASRCEHLAVVAPALPGTEGVDRSLPFEVIRIPGSRRSFAFAVLRHLPRLHRRLRFDTVLGAQWQSAWAAITARRWLGPYRVFAAAHGRELLTMHFAEYGMSWLYDQARRSTLGAVDRVIPGSTYSLRLARETGAAIRSAEVIHYGCNVDRFRPGGGEDRRSALGLDGRKVLLTLSRLMPRKGIDTVLEALPAIARAEPTVCYVVAGEGKDRARLEGIVERLGIRALVRFVGMLADDEVPSYLHMADVFAMPAREERPDVEGFGLVYLEANACGTPVIGSTSGGIPDAVVDGETGLLVPPADPAALAAAAIRLLGDAALAARLGEQGRARVLRDFTWDRVADQYLDSFARVGPAT